jgi:hypothetical protein
MQAELDYRTESNLKGYSLNVEPLHSVDVFAA